MPQDFFWSEQYVRAVPSRWASHILGARKSFLMAFGEGRPSVASGRAITARNRRKLPTAAADAVHVDDPPHAEFNASMSRWLWVR